MLHVPGKWRIQFRTLGPISSFKTYLQDPIRSRHFGDSDSEAGDLKIVGLDSAAKDSFPYILDCVSSATPLKKLIITLIPYDNWIIRVASV